MEHTFKRGLKGILAAGALATLSACAVVPAGPGIYGPAVVVPAPSVYVGGGYYRGYGGGYGGGYGRGWGGYHRGYGRW